jgi:hypothetical protein
VFLCVFDLVLSRAYHINDATAIRVEGAASYARINNRHRDVAPVEPVHCGDVENSLGSKPGSDFAFAKRPVSLLIRFMNVKIPVENNLREKPRC